MNTLTSQEISKRLYAMADGHSNYAATEMLRQAAGIVGNMKNKHDEAERLTFWRDCAKVAMRSELQSFYMGKGVEPNGPLDVWKTVELEGISRRAFSVANIMLAEYDKRLAEGIDQGDGEE